jgi:hypothetical protein
MSETSMESTGLDRALRGSGAAEEPESSPPVIPVSPPPPPEVLVRLADLTSEMCRFPYEAPGEPGFGFCGRKRDGSPYCEGHHRLCLFPVPKVKRRKRPLMLEARA